jgi:protein-S-isoprenylcysteine O-methyltransferase Ste14
VAAVGSSVFFVLAPGFIAALVPYWLTGWRMGDLWPEMLVWPIRFLGIVLIVAGAAVVIQAFARFVNEGLGTPAPVAPPERLVVGGLYRHVRNPMYVAVTTAIVGQALLLGQRVLFELALVVWLAMASFVRWYEEPTLRRRYGAAYDAYCRAVPAWIPRLTPAPKP